jgi:hypothetical protein
MRLTLRLFFHFLLIAFAPACQAFQRYKPVSVLVRDAETKQPIQAAQVKIWYPPTQDAFPYQESSGLSGDDGVARLRAAASGSDGITVESTADGYLAEQVSMVAAAADSKASGAKDRPPDSVVVEMYTAPRATIELVVPTGYVGLITVRLEIHDEAKYAPRQRLFRYEVHESGLAQLTGPPLFRRLVSADYRARYADGTPLPQKAGPLDTGLRWFKCDGQDQIFVVGTQSDFDRVRRMQAADEALHRDKKGGGSHSGGRRRGKQKSDD